MSRRWRKKKDFCTFVTLLNFRLTHRQLSKDEFTNSSRRSSLDLTLLITLSAKNEDESVHHCHGAKEAASVRHGFKAAPSAVVEAERFVGGHY